MNPTEPTAAESRRAITLIDPNWYDRIYNETNVGAVVADGVGAWQLTPIGDGRIQMETHQSNLSVEIVIGLDGLVESVTVTR